MNLKTHYFFNSNQAEGGGRHYFIKIMIGNIGRKASYMTIFQPVDDIDSTVWKERSSKKSPSAFLTTHFFRNYFFIFLTESAKKSFSSP